jgi:LmbE family N-acetylglucosaminyl deacetylase
MATLVAFHAHPDDECIVQAGTLAKAAAEGHRVVVVYATGGEVGQVPDGFLTPGETLVERRMVEARQSAEILGVDRVAWLGYRDSGMMGTPDNDYPSCFWRADVAEAAAALAAILSAEQADVLTVYDRNGNYGHPDHIQVHRVGLKAAELAGTPHVLELTVNRDHVRRLLAEAVAAGMRTENMPDLEDPGVVFGMPEEVITTTVDVRPWIDKKRASMAAHASQGADTAPLLAMPVDTFREGLGWEFYIRRGVPSTHRDHDIFAGVGS